MTKRIKKTEKTRKTLDRITAALVRQAELLNALRKLLRGRS